MAVRISDITLSPDTFSVVMATGVLSVAARNHRYLFLTDALGVLATVTLVLLVVVAMAAAVVATRRHTALWDLTDPDATLRLFTFVAACAVLDNRVASDPLGLRLLAVIAGSVWLLLGVLTVRNLCRHRLTELRDRAHGGWLLASVGTSGAAVVTAQLAAHTRHRQWLAASVSLWVGALGVYLAIAALIVWRAVDERLDRDGFEPDSWVLMGSLAIAVLAGDHIRRQAPAWLAGASQAITVLAWLTATVWIPPLIYFGLHRIERRPKILQYTGAWWTLVFPLGMYSAGTYLATEATGWPQLRTVSPVFFWVAAAAACIVAGAGLLRVPRAYSTRTSRVPATSAAPPANRFAAPRRG